MTDPRFEPFEIHEFTYKVVSGTPIETSVLIPKELGPGKYPVLVRWHGGYLITGARKYSAHLHQHVLDFARQKSAIIVNPDYRLFPEANGNEILDDVADFWLWLRRDLVVKMASLGRDIEPDLGNVLVRGESAGGYLALQSALLHPEMKFKAAIAAYPILDVTSPFFSKPYAYDKKILGRPSPPPSLLTEFLASMKPGTVVPSDETLSRSPLMLAIINQGRYFEFLSRDAQSESEIARVQPIRNLERVETPQIPFLFVYHGNGDTGVPVEGTEVFEKRLRELHPQVNAKFVYEEGEHGFDRTASLETEWLKKGLEDVGRYWPGK